MLQIKTKKEAHSEEYAHLYAYHSVTNTHMIEMRRVFIHGHSDYKNVFVLRLICEVVVQRWTLTISLPSFQSIIVFLLDF